MKIGDQIRHKSSGSIGVITKIGNPTLYFTIIEVGTIKGQKVGDKEKTNIHTIGVTYELITNQIVK